LIIGAIEVHQPPESTDLSGLFAASQASTGFLPTSRREEK
jgi:hypothetical protein